MNKNVLNLTKMALVAAIYVVLGLMTMPMNFGVLQFRLSETTNVIAVFNKRYIWAITIGCFIVNLFSSLTSIDLIIGPLNTLLITGGSYLLSKLVKNYWAKLAIVPFVGAASMFMIAFELTIIAKAPFWPTYGALAVSEFITCALGVIVFGFIEKALPEKYKLAK